MICVPPFKGKAWSKLTSIAVIVTNQNMLKDMEKGMAGILIIVAIPAVRFFSWNTLIKPANPALKSGLST
ncbi:transposase (fragment) [Xenorhabdus poinarii G6]|uniref:Transposase n=1 Tax=Xenorhabdus poinarii G6 TaxID=1354304 RepID=A0A068R3L5_9GAMM